MIRHDLDARALAMGLSALAGYVDAIAFIASGGYFASFMSGNSTRFAVGLVDSAGQAAIPAALIVTFVAGVAGGTVVGHRAGARRRLALLILVTALLALAATLADLRHLWSTAFVMAFAMGAVNAVFERDGETRVGLTYMTGSLVRIGHGLAGLILGKRLAGWGAYALLWLSLTLGAIAGAVGYARLGTTAIWLACGWGVALTLFVATRMRGAG
ncbi:YoaK family protein [Sphingomonas sp.]|uniref:YoaK family protein n=1 Tax=Sphingomonas sp. TaxID=28214 RepID=UPI002C65D3D4|nr:YoaK family protein [Sphingomonas sp.]HWK34902.1 YoaK family protein [Sphingomonas sp.]